MNASLKTYPIDCYCFNPSIQTLISEGKQLYKVVTDSAGQFMTEQALEAGEKLLDIPERRLGVSWMYIGDTYIKLYNIAMERVETLPRAKLYLRSAIEISKKICPYSERRTTNFEKLLEHEVFSYAPWLDIASLISLIRVLKGVVYVLYLDRLTNPMNDFKFNILLLKTVQLLLMKSIYFKIAVMRVSSFYVIIAILKITNISVTGLVKAT